MSIYKNLRKQSIAKGESNDCSVVALAVVTGLSYKLCHKALSDAGRVPRRGVQYHKIISSLELLGFKLSNIIYFKNTRPFASGFQKELFDRYPPLYRPKNITTKHFKMLPQVFSHLKNPYLVFSNGHVSGFINGELHDWAANKSPRVTEMWEITKI